VGLQAVVVYPAVRASAADRQGQRITFMASNPQRTTRTGRSLASDPVCAYHWRTIAQSDAPCLRVAGTPTLVVGWPPHDLTVLKVPFPVRLREPGHVGTPGSHRIPKHSLASSVASLVGVFDLCPSRLVPVPALRPGRCESLLWLMALSMGTPYLNCI
jgi:hypothetical protein